MSPILRHVKNFVGWDGGLAAVTYPAGMYFLSVDNFFMARALFTGSAILLAVRAISASEQFDSKKGKVVWCIAGTLAAAILWVISWYWVLSKEVGSLAPAFWEWFASYFIWIWRIPFRRVSIALGISGLIALVVLAFIRQRRERCPDKRLHLLAERDKASINEYVWVTSIYYQPAFDKSEPYIDFVFWIFNNSLFDVVIKFQDGFILYGDDNEQFHFPPKFIAQTPARCWSRSGTNFVIRQGIMQDAITRRFGKPDNIRISFGNLKIKFVVEQFPEMDAVSLDVNHYLQTAEHAWHNPNRPKFFGPGVEHLSELTADTGEALTKAAQLEEHQTNEQKKELLERVRIAEMNAASAGQLATVAHSAATSMATRMDTAPSVDRAMERRNRIGEWRSTLVGSRRRSRNPKEARPFAQIFKEQPQYQSLKGHLSETTREVLNTGYVNERLVSDDELEQMITDDIFRKEKEWDLL